MHPVGRRDEGIPPYASPSVPRRRGRAKLGTSQQSLERRSRAWNVARFSRVGMFLARRDALGAPRTPRHIRPERFGEFAACTNLPDLLSYLSPMPPGRPEAVPYGGDGAQCEYPWRCLNPTPRRRDPSSAVPPQDDNTGCRPVTSVGEKLAPPGCPPCRKRGVPQCSHWGGGDTSFVSAVGAAFGRLKLSTKCRQLEKPKWKLPKKFPFWHRLNVKGGIPSPLHNPPMRVQACRTGLSTV